MASTVASSAVAICFNQSLKRDCISRAALRVKVMASISPGFAPSSNARTMRDTSSHVLPLPAQAEITTLRVGSSACALSEGPEFMVLRLSLL